MSDEKKQLFEVDFSSLIKGRCACGVAIGLHDCRPDCKANLFFNQVVGEAERLWRRTPASLARLPGELHELVLGPRDPVVCPHCRVRAPGALAAPPEGVMFECVGCGDGIIVRRAGGVG